MIRVAFLALALLIAPHAYAQTLGGPYTLKDGSGQTVTEKTNSGKFTLITFAHSKCDQSCKDSLKRLSAAVSSLPAEKIAKIKTLVVSVDPTDTPAAMTQFLAPYPGLTGLTGNNEQVSSITKSFMAPVVRVPQVNGQGGQLMVNSLIYVMSKQGTFYTLLQTFDEKQLAAQLDRLIN